jgi:hypothetical protein
MNKHITFEDLAVRNQAGFFSPEKLSTLKRVFDTVCEEAAIPVGTKSERNDLAMKLITAASIEEHESLLLVFARKAVANYRW